MGVAASIKEEHPKLVPAVKVSTEAAMFFGLTHAVRIGKIELASREGLL
jgi:hypothetical protein